MNEETTAYEMPAPAMPQNSMSNENGHEAKSSRPSSEDAERATHRWLSDLVALLPSDLLTVLDALSETPEKARRPLALSVLYVVRSIDVITDSTYELAHLENAFLLRESAAWAETLAAQNASDDDAENLDLPLSLAPLAAEADDVHSFMAELNRRFVSFWRQTSDFQARGFSVEKLSTDENERARLRSDLEVWARDYSSRSFAEGAKTGIRVRAFFDARLPNA